MGSTIGVVSEAAKVMKSTGDAGKVAAIAVKLETVLRGVAVASSLMNTLKTLDVSKSIADSLSAAGTLQEKANILNSVILLPGQVFEAQDVDGVQTLVVKTLESGNAVPSVIVGQQPIIREEALAALVAKEIDKIGGRAIVASKAETPAKLAATDPKGPSARDANLDSDAVNPAEPDSASDANLDLDVVNPAELAAIGSARNSKLDSDAVNPAELAAIDSKAETLEIMVAAILKEFSELDPKNRTVEGLKTVLAKVKSEVVKVNGVYVTQVKMTTEEVKSFAEILNMSSSDLTAALEKVGL